MISLRKDNELKLRKDPLNKLAPLQKKMDTMLKKVGQLSNHTNGHPIYSLENNFYSYNEEVVLRETPYHTSMEHFYKHAREYKGLAIPQNYQLTYHSSQHKDYHSN